MSEPFVIQCALRGCDEASSGELLIADPDSDGERVPMFDYDDSGLLLCDVHRELVELGDVSTRDRPDLCKPRAES